MNNNITFRKYKDEDWSSICDVFFKASLVEMEGCCDLKAGRPLETYVQAKSLRYEFNKVCACDGNNVVGYIAFSQKDLSIMSLYILPNYMGKHIGRTLLRIALINLGINLNLELDKNYIVMEEIINPLFTSLFLGKREIKVVCMSNNFRALALYRSHGFIPINMYMDILNGYQCMYTNMSKEIRVKLGSSK